MASVVLGLQGGIARGPEPTFDGQPMQPGIHLRWSFLPELGFPPGAFWLCRRVVKKRGQRVPPPSRVVAATKQEVQLAVSALPGENRWQATMPAPCQSVTLAGRAGKGCRELIIETFGRNAKGVLVVTSRRAIPIEGDCFRVTVKAAEISCVRVAGAGSVDECGGTVEPPPGCGDGGGEEPGDPWGDPPKGDGPPGWGKPGENGWQCWTVPFTLPVTHRHWPPRYYKAPDPFTTSVNAVAQYDIAEAAHRLGSLQLAAALTPAEQHAALTELQWELVRLVENFSGVLLPDVAIEGATPGSNAPQLSISVMQQLLMLALDPYFARVLGLYFVDTDIQPGVDYEYCITGYWKNTPCQVQKLFPGLAPAAPLARGAAAFAGMKINTNSGSTMWRWLRDDGQGNYLGKTDPGAPGTTATVMATAISGMAAAAQPRAMLAAVTTGIGFFFLTPPPSVRIKLPRGAMRVDVRVAGRGTVSGIASNAVVATAGFNTSQLTTVTVNAANPDTPLDTIDVTGFAALVPLNAVIVAEIDLHPLAPDAIGTRYARLYAPKQLVQLPAEPKPSSSFRHRQAEVEEPTLDFVPRSLYEIEWSAPPAAAGSGDPVNDPYSLPPPTKPVGFVAERRDSAKPSITQRLDKRIVTASQAKPPWPKVPTSYVYRFTDAGLLDPAGGWSHRVAAFDLFGALGKWSPWTAPRGVEKIAAAPTTLRIVDFDNSAAGGGAAAANSSSWDGGELTAAVNWSGASFLMYPDIKTARATVAAVDLATGAVGATLATADIALPVRKASKLKVASVTVAPVADNASLVKIRTSLVTIKTTPDLPDLGPRDPAAVLVLMLPDGAQERFVVRPQNAEVQLHVGDNALIVTAAAQFVNQTAYLVQGWGTKIATAVPLHIPVTERTARGQISVKGSTLVPFDPNEQIVDPNGINAARPEPSSAVLKFTGAQRLVPPTPPTPTHEVHHVYYDPADFNGRAGKTLPFVAASGTGIGGYFLMRAPMQSLMLADFKRRNGLHNAADLAPEVDDSPGVFRDDLRSWIQDQLPNWLAAYNQRAVKNFTLGNALEDADAQRSFMEHFYGGLLDEELRALADMPENRMAFGRANSKPLAANGAQVFDAVDGTGFGRNVYKFASVNAAGSQSDPSGSIGPYYTRIVTPPRPPVLYKLQPTEQAIVVAWTLDANPDVAGYLIYRAASVDDLKDLRYFGPDPAHPSPPASLASVSYTPIETPCLALGGGSIDPRIVGFVPDPRLCARDYDGSDMGEVALPQGPVPDAVNGVYRLAEFNAANPPLSQPQAFNYWTPPATGGIAQLVTDSPIRSRLTGLRIGLGRGVPVVVVATWQGEVKVLGQVPVRRAGFVDGAFASGGPMDANAIAGANPPSTAATNAYAVVAVDIYGNVSKPSTIFAAQMLAKASGS